MLASMCVDRPNICQADASQKLSKQSLGCFALKNMYVKKEFSGLTAEPTNWPLARNYDPNTPLVT